MTTTAAAIIPSAVPANFEKLRGRANFSEWKFTLRYHLEDRDLYNACTQENTDASIDRRARSAIVSSVASNVIKEILNCETAKSMWERLSNLYEDNNPNRFITLNQEMFSTKLENCKDMAEYIEKMRSIGIKMRTILPEYPDQAVAANILTNLPAYFRPLTMALENSVQKLTTDLVCEKLLSEYAKMGNQEQNAYTSRTNHESKFYGKCNSCGKIGHKAKFCRSKKTKSSFINKRDARPEKQKEEYNPRIKEAWVMNTDTKISDEPWIIDSGSDRHMTSHREFFSNFVELAPSPVRTGGTVIHSVGEGSVTLNIKRNDTTIEVTLNHVLYVPELTANLISVKFLAKKLNILTVFDADNCKLIDKHTKQILATGTSKGENLYYLDTVKNTAMINTKSESINMWHKRLAHLSYPGLQRLKSMAYGINFSDDPDNCVPCIKGKIHRQPFPNQKVKRAKDVLELVHSDLCGPMEIPSHGGARYFFTITDDKSRMTFVTFLKTKDEVYQKFVDFKVYVERQTGKKLKTIRTDRGTEFINSQMKQLFKREGIAHQMTIAHTPEQNGVSERCNRTLVERARAMLNEANLDQRFWAEAISTATYCKNRSPTIAVNGKTPFEAWTGEKPDLQHMKTFGCKAFSHIPKSQRKKWDNKAKDMIFVGYSQDSKGYRLMDPSTFKITEARDVVFLELETCTASNNSEPEPNSKFYEDELLFPIYQQSPKIPVNQKSDDSTPEINIEVPIRKSKRESKMPSYLQDYDTPLGQHHCHMSTALHENTEHIIDIPLSYNDALAHEDAVKWKGAISEELQAHKRNQTWDIVPLPSGCKTIKSKWVFKIKNNADGMPERYKARLVAKGCSQKAGIDYTETFSPVVRYETLRVLLAMSTLYDWDIDHLDAVVAFLQGNIEEEIYIEPPEGLEISKERGSEKFVCRLKKGMYGLKQSGRAWYTKLDDNLKDLGLISADFDCCVYHKIDDKNILIIAVYVDDLLIFSNCFEYKTWIKEQLFERFEMKDLGELKYCLGIEIQRDREKGITTIKQSTYIESILKKFSMHDSKPVSTPTDVNQKLSKSSNIDEKLTTIYQSAVGSLLYAAKGTRPDIAYVVSLLCQYCSSASNMHWVAAKRVMRYLQGTAKIKLTYSRSANSEFIGYCDSDYAGCPDDRKSTTGFVFKLAGGAVTWQSKKQSTVATSTVEAEYTALASATKEALWLKKFLKELNLPTQKDPITIFCDNKGAIDLSKNSIFHARTKHIDVAHHITRDSFKKGLIMVEKISTEVMIADSLTKSVPRQKHEWCRNNMGLY